MSQQKQQDTTGRTIYDLIAERPKLIFASLIILVILVIFSIIIWGPLKVGTWEVTIGKQSNNSIPCDTLRIRDTIYIVNHVQTDAKSKKSTTPTKQIQVQSVDQKGGQTAGEIINY